MNSLNSILPWLEENVELTQADRHDRHSIILALA